MPHALMAQQWHGPAALGRLDRQNGALGLATSMSRLHPGSLDLHGSTSGEEPHDSTSDQEPDSARVRLAQMVKADIASVL